MTLKSESRRTRNTIQVVVDLTAPMHIAYPGGSDGGHQSTFRDEVTVGQTTYAMPILPANSLRGAFRRAIGRRLIDAICMADGPMPGNVYRGLLSGSGDAAIDRNGRSLEEIIRAHSHVYLGLFGGGSRMLETMYSVGDMMAVCDVNIAAGRISDSLRDMGVSVIADRAPEKGERGYARPFRGKRFFTRVDDMARMLDPMRLAGAVEGGVQAVADYQQQVLENAMARKAEKDADNLDDDERTTKTDVAQIQSIEVIPAGTRMAFLIEMSRDVSPAMVGALLIAIDELLSSNLGSYARWSWGTIRLHQMVLKLSDQVITVDAGTLPAAGLEAVPALAGYINPAYDEISAVRLADVVEFFTDYSAEAKAREKAVKAQKKADKKAQALALAAAD